MRIISLVLILLLAMAASAETPEVVSDPDPKGIYSEEATQNSFWNDKTLARGNKGIGVIEDMLNLFLGVNGIN